jgi:hypothetical protein
METIRDAWRYGLRVALWNLRFRAGYRLGGFTHASR